jgi:hypothetical protein
LATFGAGQVQGAKMAAEEHPISRVIDGVTVSGTFTVENGIVTVKTAFNKAAQVGDSSPQGLAFIMLRELLEDMRTGHHFSDPDRPQ